MSRKSGRSGSEGGRHEGTVRHGKERSLEISQCGQDGDKSQSGYTRQKEGGKESGKENRRGEGNVHFRFPPRVCTAR